MAVGKGFEIGVSNGGGHKITMTIDTHCHVDLYDAPISVVRAVEAKHIATIGVTYLPSHFQLAQEHLHMYAHVKAAMGLHPLSAAEHARELALFKELCPIADFIGEVGLDFSAAGKASRATQEASFAAVLSSVSDRPRFVSLHSRGAEDIVLAHLEEAGVPNAVFHWFSGSRAQLLRVVDAGHLLSINPAMIRTAKWNDFIRLVPPQAVLTESDGPFAKQDGRPTLPTDMHIVIDWLSTSWHQTPQQVAEQVARNCCRVPVLGNFAAAVAALT